MSEPTTEAGRRYAREVHDAMHGDWCGRPDDEGVTEGLGYPADAGFIIDPILAIEAEARRPALDAMGDMPDQLTVNGHLFVHVAACPCPRIQDEVARLEAGRAALDAAQEDEHD